MDSCVSSSESITFVPLAHHGAAPMGVTIRCAKLQDIQGLTEVLLQSFHPPRRWSAWFHPLLRLGIYEDLRSRLRASSPHYTCLIALRAPDEEIIGTAEISLRGWFYPQARTGYISNLAVSPAHRRHGVARQLLLKCEQVARDWNCHTLALHVLDNNHSAKSLYDDLGYQTQGTDFQWPTGLFHWPRRLLLEKSLAV
ncbi:GNAT family N-acetyltransferase [Synechocystis sp. LKSZ1]|uniref:GNAT family N-acetyltransferase n=1 Tax=Synechocystis sp. LKSZ1 TaxID=3144951 RepID=UPI00336C1273